MGAFDAIAAKVDGGSPIDGVLIETTGMADPVPIIRTILTTPAISRRFLLDGTITLADAKHVEARLREREKALSVDPALAGKAVDEAYQQIMFADRIILNKVRRSCCVVQG